MATTTTLDCRRLLCPMPVIRVQDKVATLAPEALKARLAKAYERMAQAGAHYVVDGILDCPRIVDEIDDRLKRGERP